MKVIFDNLVNLENQTSAVVTINNNNDRLATAMDKTLSRDGTTPNEMESNLDMNDNRIVNLPKALTNTEPVRLTEFNELTDDLINAVANAGGSVVIDPRWGQITGNIADQTDLASLASNTTWGSITGTLSAQTDLQTALNNKLDDSQATAFGLSILGASSKTVVLDTLGIAKGFPEYNTVVGANARPTGLYNGAAPLLTGADNTVFGRDTLTSASNNNTLCAVFGSRAMELSADTYASIALGYRAFRALQGGVYMTAVGIDCFPLATSGSSGVAMGAHAGTNKAGDLSRSAVIGSSAAYCGGSVTNCVIVGFGACDGNATSTIYDQEESVVVGTYAGRLLTGLYNVIIGNNAGSLTGITGSYNLLIGRSSGSALTSGNGNTMIGDNAGGGLATGSFNTMIGFGVSANGNYTNSTGIGNNADITASNQMRLGNASLSEVITSADVVPAVDNASTVGKSGARWSAIWAANGTIQTSDVREKNIVRDISADEAKTFVKSVNPFYHTWKIGGREIVEVGTETKTRPTLDKLGNKIMETYEAPKHEIIERKGSRVHASVSAQDVKKAMDAIGMDFGGWCLDDKKDPDSPQSIRPDQLMWMLWKTVQSLMQEVEELKKGSK